MDLILFSQPVSETEASNKPLQLRYQVITRILKLLDIETLILIIPRVCNSLYHFCGRYPGVRHPFLGYMGHIYESLVFSRGAPIIQPAPEGDFRPLYFRSDAYIHLNRGGQPEEVQIHVFTTYDSKRICLDDVTSMFIKLSNPYSDPSEAVPMRVLGFIANLLLTDFKNLKNLKLSGFRLTAWLWELLHKFRRDWIHVTGLSPYTHQNFIRYLPWCRKLHLDLENNFDMNSFPPISSFLEELSLRFSNLKGKHTLKIDCDCLKKM